MICTSESGAELTQNELRRRLHYEPETGIFRWIVPRYPAQVGRVAGTPAGRDRKYISIGIDKRYYLAHRLAWLYMTGSWPKEEIDHADLDSKNNKFSNLREATPSQNTANRSRFRRKYDLPKGVIRISKNRYSAFVYFCGKRINVGSFKTPELAHSAYVKAAEEMQGAFARPA